MRMTLTLPLVPALMFAPAGSFRFWQGWVFTGVFVLFSIAFVADVSRRDPALLESRLRNKEVRPQQKRFKMLWVPLWIVTLTLPGFDYRFGWSAALLGRMPLWLMAAGWAVLIYSWLLVLYVMRVNTFASAIVEVQAGQRVISDGPYAIVRHPMYSGFVLMIIATPFSLGSYLAVLPAVLLIPVIVMRLLDEEHALTEKLPGYAEYCQKTRFRLLPGVF